MDLANIRPNNLPTYTKRTVGIALAFLGIAAFNPDNDNSTAKPDAAVGETVQEADVKVPEQTKAEAELEVAGVPSEEPSPEQSASADSPADETPADETPANETPANENTAAASPAIEEPAQVEPIDQVVEATPGEAEAQEATTSLTFTPPTDAKNTTAETAVVGAVSAAAALAANAEKTDSPAPETAKVAIPESTKESTKESAQETAEKVVNEVATITKAEDNVDAMGKEVTPEALVTAVEEVTAVEQVAAVEEAAVEETTEETLEVVENGTDKGVSEDVVQDAAESAVAADQSATDAIDVPAVAENTAATEEAPVTAAPPPEKEAGKEAEEEAVAVTTVAEVTETVAEEAPEVAAATEQSAPVAQEVTVPESTPVVGVTQTPEQSLDGTIPAPKAISDLVANYSDKLLMVVFWSVATETESPSFDWLNEMHRRYANRGLQIMAVNQDKAAREGEAFAVKKGAQFEVTHDRSGDLRRALWVGKLPATYLLNDAGELLGSHTGFNDDIRGSYEDEIRRLLRNLR